MERVLSTAIAALAVGILSSAAHSADLGGGAKDGSSPGIFDAPRNSARGGFYIKGDLGIANGDRSVSRNISGEAGEVNEDDHGPDRENNTADDTLTDAFYYDPEAIGALNSINDSGSFDSTVFGGEVSYLWHRPASRVGLEVAVGATFYNDSKTSHGFDDVIAGKFREIDDGVLGAPEDFDVAIAGYTDVERDLDIDLILRGHYFLAHNLSVYAGGGLSLAKATISGGAGAEVNGDPVEHSFKDSVWAPGYVLNAGAQFWLTEQITIGVDYTYKVHEFDTTKSSLFEENPGDEGDYLSVKDKASVEDEVHAIKARLGVKLGGGFPSLD
jgi:opacity protein-like surface antigen